MNVIGDLDGGRFVCDEPVTTKERWERGCRWLTV